MIIFVTIAMIASIIGIFVKFAVDDKFGDCIFVLAIAFIFLLSGAVLQQNENTNIATQNITTYTYQCQICEETTTTTNEPKIMICDDCKEAIKNLEKEIKENERYKNTFRY